VCVSLSLSFLSSSLSCRACEPLFLIFSPPIPPRGWSLPSTLPPPRLLPSGIRRPLPAVWRARRGRRGAAWHVRTSAVLVRQNSDGCVPLSSIPLHSIHVL
jgi:hypothetical protein